MREGEAFSSLVDSVRFVRVWRLFLFVISSRFYWKKSSLLISICVHCFVCPRIYMQV